MKVTKLAGLLLCFLLCACEGDTIDPGKAGRSLRLQAEIEGLTTRASNDSWEKDDAIGVYMMKAGEPLNASSLRKNVMYTTSGSTTFVPADEAEEIILPFDDSDVDFISYYPYSDRINDFLYPVDVSNQSQQAAIDLMYADNAKNFNAKNPNVRMQFSHQLSKIILNIVQDEPVNLKDLSVVLTNAATQATFELATGLLSAGATSEDIQFRMNDDGSVAEAILLPETDLSGMDLWFILGEGAEVYTFPLANAIGINAFEKSTRYTYNVTLFADETKAITDGNITDWIEGPSENITAQQTTEDPPLIKGSQRNPYTVAEAQTNPEKTGVWVTGFIVGSFTSSSVGSFSPDVSVASSSNLALADQQDETETDRMVPVQLPTGALRNALNLMEHPENKNVKVMIKGNLASYFGVLGVRDCKEYQFVDSQ